MARSQVDDDLYMTEYEFMYICVIVSFSDCDHFQFVIDAIPGSKFPRDYGQVFLKRRPGSSCARCATDTAHPEYGGEFAKYDKPTFAKLEQEALDNSVMLVRAKTVEEYISPTPEQCFLEGLAIGRLIQIHDRKISRNVIERVYRAECASLRTKLRTILDGQRKDPNSRQKIFEAQTTFARMRFTQGVAQGRLLQSDARWRAWRLFGRTERERPEHISGTVCGGPGGGPIIKQSHDPWYQPQFSKLDNPGEEWGNMPDHVESNSRMAAFEKGLKGRDPKDDWYDTMDLVC